MRRPCFPNSGSHQHGPPLLGRVRTPPRSPTSTLLCSPPTPSSPSAAAPVVPRQRPTSVRRLVLHRRTGASADRCNAGDISTPAPHKPALSRGETRDPTPIPGAWAILFVRAVVLDPAGCDHPSPVLGEVAVAFRRVNTLGTRNRRLRRTCFFRGYLPTAHSLACLRFAESVTVSGARLATGRAGSPFAGRVSHPLDDKQGFMGSSHTPFPLDQPCLVALPPKLIIFNGFLVGARAQHCQGQIRQRDRFATTVTIPTRNGDFGATRAGSEWPARRAHSTACPNA